MKNKIMNEKPWALSSFLSLNNKSRILEIMNTSNDNSKYWIHLNYADVIEYINGYIMPQNGHKLITKKSLFDNRYFNSFSSEYIPIDSSVYRVGTIQIPMKNINETFIDMLPDIDKELQNRYIGGAKIPNKYKSASIRFILKDNENNSQSVTTAPVSFNKIKGLNGPQVFSL